MSGIGDPSSRYNVLSNWGRLAGKLTEQEYPRTVLNKYDKFLLAIKEAKAELENNKKEGAEEKGMYL